MVGTWAGAHRCGSALLATQRVTEGLRQLGVTYAGMFSHSDPDPLPTGYAWAEQVAPGGQSAACCMPCERTRTMRK